MNNEDLEFRRDKIGASDAPIIMKLFPYNRTPHMLWEEKLFGKRNEVNSAMQRGIEMEEAARNCFEKDVGIEIFGNQRLIHKEIPWMMATLDGLSLDGKVAVEIKCTNRENHQLALDGKVPEIYYPQLQHQLEVSGNDSMYYFSFTGTAGAVVEVKRDQSYIDQMLEEEEKFYNLLMEKQPPELTDKDYVSMEDSDHWINIAQNWSHINAQIKLLEEKEAVLRKSLINATENRNAKGGGIKVTKVTTKGHIDYSLIPEIQGMDLDKYRKPSSIKWRITDI